MNCDLSDEAFPFSTNKVVKVKGHDARLLRVTFPGELGELTYLVPLDISIYLFACESLLLVKSHCSLFRWLKIFQL